MKAVALVTLFCTLAACASAPPRGPALQPTWVEIDGAMLGFLDSIHDGLKTEIMLCLNGEVRRGVVFVTRFRATPVREATRERIYYDQCAPDEFVGVVHSHPSDGGCYLSLVDEATAKQYGHQIDIVVCGGGMFAWATRTTSGIIARRGS